MKEKLSSDFTFFYKSLWLIFVIGLGIILFVTDVPVEGKFIYLVFWTIGAFIFWGVFNDLRTVEVDASFLYVKNGGITVTVPFSIIKSVQQEWIMLRYPVIVVRLKIPTGLGLEIKFMPHYVFMLLYRQHPVVNQLRRLANLPAN